MQKQSELANILKGSKGQSCLGVELSVSLLIKMSAVMMKVREERGD